MKTSHAEHFIARGLWPMALVLAAGAVTLAGCGNTQDTAERADTAAEYVITGNVSDLLEEGEVVLSRGTAVLGGTEEFGRARLAGGEFELRGEFTHGGAVYLAIVDAEDERKGSLQLILEPAEIRVEYTGEVTGLRAHGGPYQQQVVASWQQSDAYTQALAAYRDVMQRRSGLEEGDDGFEELKQESWDRYNEQNRIRYDALRAIAESNEDPLASLYAMQLGGMGGDEALARLDVLEADLGEHPALVAMRSRITRGQELRAAAAAMQEGTQVEDFSSMGLDGLAYHLQDARTANEYTLVEFWASWCGPCRAENPNLIASRENYGPKGFEVFAYSLDDDREAWAEASEEDGIPWINTSDLLAYDSPIPGQFGVTAIPMNFLLDSDGVIVARNLRGETLDLKLAELIDGAAAATGEL